MGNISPHFQKKENEIKKLQTKAENFLLDSPLSNASKQMLRRIIMQPRQKHLLHILKGMKLPEQQNFFSQVRETNIELLDSLYEYLIEKRVGGRDSSKLEKKNQLECNCGYGNIKKKKQVIVKLEEAESLEIVNLADLKDENKQFLQEYERIKQLGLQKLRSSKVCFIMMAGGENLRFQQNQFLQHQLTSKYKQLNAIPNLPSQFCLFQLILLRLYALAKLIQVAKPLVLYIMVSNEQKEKEMRKIHKKIRSERNCQNYIVKIKFIFQTVLGALDVNGQLVVNKQTDSVFLVPNGSGDIWDFFQKDPIMLEEVKTFQFVQIFGTSNSLQHVFDCYMIGKLVATGSPWTILCANQMEYSGQSKLNHQSNDIMVGYNSENRCLQFIENDEQIQRSHSEQLWNKHSIFLNNSVVSTKFMSKVFGERQQEWNKKRKFYCKCKSVQFLPKIKNSPNILIFQKKMTDIFKMSEKGCIMMVDGKDFYKKLISYHDLFEAALAISQLHSSWLHLNNDLKLSRDLSFDPTKICKERRQRICEIDPFISLEGENLEQIEMDLKQMEIEYPIHIQEEIEQNQEQYPII